MKISQVIFAEIKFSISITHEIENPTKKLESEILKFYFSCEKMKLTSRYHLEKFSKILPKTFRTFLQKTEIVTLSKMRITKPIF